MLVWLVRTRSDAEWPQLEKVLPAHLAHESVVARAGHLMAAGPIPKPDGTLNGDALTLFFADSADAARALAEADPFVQHGLRRVIAVDGWDVRNVGWRMNDLAPNQ